MQIQDLSYQLINDSIKIKNYSVSLEVFSFDNVYTVPIGGLKKIANNSYIAKSLMWGNSQVVQGGAELKIDSEANADYFDISANLNRPVRCVKLRFDNLPLGKLISLISEDKNVDERGLLLHYPEGWRSLSTPLLVFEIEKDKYLYIRIDMQSVYKCYFYMKKQNEGMRVDVVIENIGTKIANNFVLPRIECGYVKTKEQIYAYHAKCVEDNFQLWTLKKSPIVPSWLADIDLVITMHMQSFTGYIFHTYEDAYRDVEKIAQIIDPKRILVYLAGWEGRYYYKYGDYTPDERLGGDSKLKEMVAKIHSLGAKVIAMYGMNMANKNIPAVKRIYKRAEFESVSGAKYHSGSVDWDGSHHYDFGELVQLNIANPLWQNYLFKQISDATKKYDFDGAFLDIAACFTNDKNYYLYDGVVDFCNRLRTIKDDFLVAGEGCYDALIKAMPLFQSGHTDGAMHYHDRLSPTIFARYAREFAHLCLGDPSRDSTGVHEQGNNVETRTPLRKGIIPTLSLVDGTIEKAFDKVESIVKMADEYKEIKNDE